MPVIKTRLEKDESFARRSERWRRAPGGLEAEAETIRAGGGERRGARHQAKDKMLARKRVAALCDADSFVERGLWAGDGMYGEHGEDRELLGAPPAQRHG